MLPSDFFDSGAQKAVLRRAERQVQVDRLSSVFRDEKLRLEHIVSHVRSKSLSSGYNLVVFDGHIDDPTIHYNAGPTRPPHINLSYEKSANYQPGLGTVIGKGDLVDQYPAGAFRNSAGEYIDWHPYSEDWNYVPTSSDVILERIGFTIQSNKHKLDRNNESVERLVKKGIGCLVFVAFFPAVGLISALFDLLA
jgi:hypothetical protein